MRKKQYLTEENYERGKSTLRKIAVVVLLIGLCLGGGLIGLGAYKLANPKNNAAEITEIENKINTNKAKIAELDYKITSEFRANGLSAEYYRLDSERDILQSQNNDYSSDKFKLENGNSRIGSIALCGFGGMIVLITCGIALSLFAMTKTREIVAFGAQAVMPIAQEGTEKMAPYAGKMAEEVAKGIKRGLNSDEDEE